MHLTPTLASVDALVIGLAIVFAMLIVSIWPRDRFPGNSPKEPPDRPERQPPKITHTDLAQNRENEGDDPN